MKKLIFILFLIFICTFSSAETRFAGFEKEGEYFNIYCDLSFKGIAEYVPPTKFSQGMVRFILRNRSHKEFDLKYSKYYAVDKDWKKYRLIFKEMVCEHDLRRRNIIPSQTEVEIRCSTPQEINQDVAIQGAYIAVNNDYKIYFGVTNWWLKIFSKIERWFS